MTGDPRPYAAFVQQLCACPEPMACRSCGRKGMDVARVSSPRLLAGFDVLCERCRVSPPGPEILLAAPRIPSAPPGHGPWAFASETHP